MKIIEYIKLQRHVKRKGKRLIKREPCSLCKLHGEKFYKAFDKTFGLESL